MGEAGGVTPVPSGGFVDGLPESGPTNKDLPEEYEATYTDPNGEVDREFSDVPHVERIFGEGRVEVVRGPNANLLRTLEARLIRVQAYGVVLLDSMDVGACQVPGSSDFGSCDEPNSTGWSEV